MENVERRDGLYGFEFLEVDKRRVPTFEKRTYNIKQMWQRTHEIVNLCAQGYKNVEIAQILNITPETVSNTINSELGEAKLSEIRFGRDEEAKRTTERIRILTNKALDTYDEIFDSPDELVSILDRGKYAESFINNVSGLKTVRIQSHTVHTILSAEQLAEIKRRGIESMREAGVLAE